MDVRKTKLGALGWTSAAFGGLIGGFLTMGISAGIPMVGPLNTIALIAGALGVIGALLLLVAFITKKR